MTTSLKQVYIAKGQCTWKQSNHKSEKHNRFIEISKKRSQAYYKNKPSNHKRKNKKEKEVQRRNTTSAGK